MSDIFNQIKDMFKEKDFERGLKKVIEYLIKNEKMPPGFSKKTQGFIKKSFKEFALSELKPCTKQVEKKIDKALKEDDFSSVVRLLLTTQELRKKK